MKITDLPKMLPFNSEPDMGCAAYEREDGSIELRVWRMKDRKLTCFRFNLPLDMPCSFTERENAEDGSDLEPIPGDEKIYEGAQLGYALVYSLLPDHKGPGGYKEALAKIPGFEKVRNHPAHACYVIPDMTQDQLTVKLKTMGVWPSPFKMPR